MRRNLSGELSRRCDDQRADPVSRNSRNSIKQRQEKSGGFAGAGCGATDQISAAENNWNGLFLNWCWFSVFEGLASTHKRRVQTQLRKTQKSLFVIFLPLTKAPGPNLAGGVSD